MLNAGDTDAGGLVALRVGDDSVEMPRGGHQGEGLARRLAEKWLRKSEQRYKWKLRAQYRTEVGLAIRSF